MEDCIFCKIVKGDIPSEKLWEDDNFISFLDIRPVTEGMTLVVPRKHLPSRVFENKDEDIHSLISAAKKVSKLLKKSFELDRVAAAFEGREVNHLHLKMYPLRKGESLGMVLNNTRYNPTREELHELYLKITK